MPKKRRRLLVFLFFFDLGGRLRGSDFSYKNFEKEKYRRIQSGSNRRIPLFNQKSQPAGYFSSRRWCHPARPRILYLTLCGGTQKLGPKKSPQRRRRLLFSVLHYFGPPVLTVSATQRLTVLAPRPST